MMLNPVTGTVVANYTYAPYGAQVSAIWPEAGINPWGPKGYWTDANAPCLAWAQPASGYGTVRVTQLNDGIWLQPDPSGINGGPNPMSVDEDDPISLSDSNGLSVKQADGIAHANDIIAENKWDKDTIDVRPLGDGRHAVIHTYSTNWVTGGFLGSWIFDATDLNDVESKLNDAHTGAGAGRVSGYGSETRVIVATSVTVGATLIPGPDDLIIAKVIDKLGGIGVRAVFNGGKWALEKIGGGLLSKEVEAEAVQLAEKTVKEARAAKSAADLAREIPDAAADALKSGSEAARDALSAEDRALATNNYRQIGNMNTNPNSNIVKGFQNARADWLEGKGPWPGANANAWAKANGIQ